MQNILLLHLSKQWCSYPASVSNVKNCISYSNSLFIFDHPHYVLEKHALSEGTQSYICYNEIDEINWDIDIVVKE